MLNEAAEGWCNDVYASGTCAVLVPWVIAIGGYRPGWLQGLHILRVCATAGPEQAVSWHERIVIL